MGIGIDFHIRHDCDKAEFLNHVITGFDAVGSIVSSEYEVYCYADCDPYEVHSNAPEGKGRPCFYRRVPVSCKIYLVGGVGFNLGWRTGVFGQKRFIGSYNPIILVGPHCFCGDKD